MTGWPSSLIAAQLSPPRRSPAKRAGNSRTQPPARASRCPAGQIRHPQNSYPHTSRRNPRQNHCTHRFSAHQPSPRHDPACRIPSPGFIYTRRRSLAVQQTLSLHCTVTAASSSLQCPGGPYAAQPTQRTLCRPTASPSAPAARWWRWRRRAPRAAGNAASRRRRRSRRPPREPA